MISKPESDQERYDKLYRRQQICLGICVIAAIAVTAMVFASTQDFVIHEALRLPIIGTALVGLAFCGLGYGTHRQAEGIYGG